MSGPAGVIALLLLSLPFYHVMNAFVAVGLNQPEFGLVTRGLKDAIVWGLFVVLFGRFILTWRFRRLSAADWSVLLFGVVTLARAATGSEAGLPGIVFGGRQNLSIVAIYFIGRAYPPGFHLLRGFLLAFVGVVAVSSLVAIGEFAGFYSVPDAVGLIEYIGAAYEQESTGEYGLTWTFQTAFGMRRYSGLAGNPLEAAMLSVFGLCIVSGMATRRNANRLWVLGMQVVLLIGLGVTVSRASTAGAGAVLLATIFVRGAGVARVLAIAGVTGLVIVVATTPVLLAFVQATLALTNPSAAGHVAEWSDGLKAVATNPLGLGLGTSGLLGSRLGVGVGGESQWIITAVQLGVVGLVAYVSAWMWTFVVGLRTFTARRGSILGAAGLTLALARFGLALPASSSAFETYLSVSLPTWWLAGVLSFYLRTEVRRASSGD